MKLIVCGDSFMSPVLHYPGKHFSEIFAQHYGFTLTSYARSSVSNFHIGLQLDQAILEKPDFILFNFTNYSRLEIDSGLFEQQKQTPIRLQNMGDLLYTGMNISDKFYEDNKHQTYLISFPMTLNLSDIEVERLTNRYPFLKDKLDLLRPYITHFYNDYHKKRIDNLMMYATLHRLHLSNIPFIFVHDYANFDEIGYDIHWINSSNSIHDKVHVIRANTLSTNRDPGFHLTFEESQQVADLLIDQYKIFKTDKNIK